MSSATETLEMDKNINYLCNLIKNVPLSHKFTDSYAVTCP